VIAACRQREFWPAKVAAAVYAAIDFVAADPVRATALLPQRKDSVEGGSFEQVIDGFAELLQQTAPSTGYVVAPSSRGSVAGVVTIVADYVRSGHTGRLEGLGPELVQFVLAPYLGFSEAKQWADRPA
jgi:hypothetical protein